MDICILSCGYAYHMSPFSLVNKSPLPFYLMRLQTEGSCLALIEGEMRTVTAGDLLLFAPGSEYQLRMEPDQTGKVWSGDYYLLCDGEWVASWWERMARPQCSRVGMDEHIMMLWKQMILEQRRSGERSSELNGYLLQAMCMHFDRSLKEIGTDSRGSYIAYRMKRYIEEQAAVSFKVEDVAAQVKLSPSRAAHLFRETFGQSVMQYALKVRLSMAVERMKYSTLSLEQISASCGLGSYPYFHRVFKEKYGVAPSQYRKQWHN